MNALLPMKRLARYACVIALLTLGLLQWGSLSAHASPPLPDDGPAPTRVPETGRTLVLLGIGVVAASWAHRKSSTAPQESSRKR